MIKKLESFELSKLRYIMAPDGCLAAESPSVDLLPDVNRDLALLGSGGLAMGYRKCLAALSGKECVTDLIMMKVTDTVGADTLLNFSFKFKQPTLVTKMKYTNDTSATGTITSFKVGGEPLQLNNGFVLTNMDNFLISEFLSFLVGVTFLFNRNAEVEIAGVAVNGDVCDFLLAGKDLSLDWV